MSNSYYEHEFEIIEQGKSPSFNWAAFWGGIRWMTYRKMYRYAILNFIICFCASFGMSTFFFTSGILITLKSLSALSVITISSFFIVGIIQGMFANKWYYNTVQEKIADGYHTLPDFKPITPFGIYFGIIWAFAANYFEKKDLQEYLKTHELEKKDVEFNKHNIKKYLQNSQTLSTELKWGIAFIVIAIVFNFQFNIVKYTVSSGLKSLEQIKVQTHTTENVKASIEDVAKQLNDKTKSWPAAAKINTK